MCAPTRMPKSQPPGLQKKSKTLPSRANIVKLDTATSNPSPHTRRFDPLTAVCTGCFCEFSMDGLRTPYSSRHRQVYGRKRQKVSSHRKAALRERAKRQISQIWNLEITQVMNEVHIIECLELSAEVLTVSGDRLWVEIYEPMTEVGPF